MNNYLLVGFALVFLPILGVVAAMWAATLMDALKGRNYLAFTVQILFVLGVILLVIGAVQ